MSRNKSNTTWIYGIHAVVSALKSDKRQVLEIWGTRKVLDSSPIFAKKDFAKITRVCDPKSFSKKFGDDAVHQSLAALVTQQEDLYIEDIIEDTQDLKQGLIVCLDQVTDPHNVGAIVRSAAVFGASAVVVQDRNAPKNDAPTLVKSACGATEIVPIVRVQNLSRAIQDLQQNGWWSIGFDERGEDIAATKIKPGKHILLMGAEGSGLRRLTQENCDLIYRLPASEEFSTLNVSNAAAIGMYIFRCT